MNTTRRYLGHSAEFRGSRLDERASVKGRKGENRCGSRVADDVRVVSVEVEQLVERCDRYWLCLVARRP